MKRICHLTSVHSRNDVRIFYKECCSLSKNFIVYLIVSDGFGREKINNIDIVDVGKHEGNRISRMFSVSKLILKTAKELNCDLYHFHDPELIPVGLRLLSMGKKVIYDVHEDVPKDILYKSYINKHFRLILSNCFKLFEHYAAKRFSAIITSTPYIRNRFYAININTIDIKNYPSLTEFHETKRWNKKENEICYLGSITSVRGLYETVKAIELIECKLHLAGLFDDIKYKETVTTLEGWKKVIYYGFVNREKTKEILRTTKIGLVVLHPITTFMDSLPIKMFEYMSAGLPVIASNFPLWKDIIEENNCGICVDPLNTNDISQAINYLLNNNDIAQKMGENGRKVVEEKYNWEKEEAILIDLYTRICN
ncbi:MAG: glycosyltransferase family 4 protein [Bacteroidales bacterium]|nr:glycosyltransferase family 4 protein [Bacteroidales bacterium]